MTPACENLPTAAPYTSPASHSLLQILMNDFDEFFGGQHLRSVTAGAWIHHMFANMVFDDLCDEAVHRAPAGSGLLQHRGTLAVRVHRAFHRFNLAANSFETIEQLGFFFRDVAHGRKPQLHNYTRVGYCFTTR